jgi:hypothetical protein
MKKVKNPTPPHPGRCRRVTTHNRQSATQLVNFRYPLSLEIMQCTDVLFYGGLGEQMLTTLS